MTPRKEAAAADPRDQLASEDDAVRMTAARELAGVPDRVADEDVPAPLYPTDADVVAGRVSAG